MRHISCIPLFYTGMSVVPADARVFSVGRQSSLRLLEYPSGRRLPLRYHERNGQFVDPSLGRYATEISTRDRPRIDSAGSRVYQISMRKSRDARYSFPSVRELTTIHTLTLLAHPNFTLLPSTLQPHLVASRALGRALSRQPPVVPAFAAPRDPQGYAPRPPRSRKVSRP